MDPCLLIVVARSTKVLGVVTGRSCILYRVTGMHFIAMSPVSIRGRQDDM